MENTKSLVIIDNGEINKYSNEAMSGHVSTYNRKDRTKINTSIQI